MKIPTIVGKALYLFGYHFIYFGMRGSHRAYVLIWVGNRVLLTKNWLGLQRDWRLPGGGINPSEDLKTGVARELSEEIGVIIDPQQLRPISDKTYRSRHGYYYNLFEITLDSKPLLKIHPNEISSAKFVDKKQLCRLPLSEMLHTAKNELDWS